MNLLIPIGILAVFLLMGKSSSSTSASKSIKKKENTSLPITIGLYKSYGVSEISFEAAQKLLKSTPNLNLKILTSKQIRSGSLKDINVFIAMGGSGSQQGKDLQTKGIEEVRNFVKNGGGYIGVCGGSYLAIVGKSENGLSSENRLAMVAAKNYGNDGWQRGNGDCELETNDKQKIWLHYENGPIFDSAPFKGASPYISLADFITDFYIPSKGTYKGDMPGQPGIITANYGNGRIILFSPNPILGGAKVLRNDMFLDAIWFVSKGGKISSNIKFGDVFG